jgi:hypothetical protein
MQRHVTREKENSQTQRCTTRQWRNAGEYRRENEMQRWWWCMQREEERQE